MINAEVHFKSGDTFDIMYPDDYEFLTSSFTEKMLHTLVSLNGFTIFTQGNNIEYIKVYPPIEKTESKPMETNV